MLILVRMHKGFNSTLLFTIAHNYLLTKISHAWFIRLLNFLLLSLSKTNFSHSHQESRGNSHCVTILSPNRCKFEQWIEKVLTKLGKETLKISFWGIPATVGEESSQLSCPRRASPWLSDPLTWFAPGSSELFLHGLSTRVFHSLAEKVGIFIQNHLGKKLWSSYLWFCASVITVRVLGLLTVAPMAQGCAPEHSPAEHSPSHQPVPRSTGRGPHSHSTAPFPGAQHNCSAMAPASSWPAINPGHVGSLLTALCKVLISVMRYWVHCLINICILCISRVAFISVSCCLPSTIVWSDSFP